MGYLSAPLDPLPLDEVPFCPFTFSSAHASWSFSLFHCILLLIFGLFFFVQGNECVSIDLSLFA